MNKINPLRRIPGLALVPGIAATLFLTPLALRADVSVLGGTTDTPLKAQPAEVTLNRWARLHNDRVLYQLSYGALGGEPLNFSPDKQIEGTRRPYRPYKPALTADQQGFTALGLAPEANWDDLGFFNLFVNDIGLEYVAPTLSTHSDNGQVSAQLIWRNSQATVTQTFVLREGDDKLLMHIAVEPLPGVKIERLVLRLRNVARQANTAYGNPSSAHSAVYCAQHESLAPGRLDLDPATQYWTAYTNADLGSGPSGLLYLPSQVDKAYVLQGATGSITNLVLKSAERSFDVCLWEIPKLPNASFVGYLNAAGPALRDALAKVATSDWKAPLPALGTEKLPLHLTPGVRKIDAAEQKAGFVLSRSHPLQYVDFNSLPAAAPADIALTTAPGQTAQAAFALYALRNLGRTTISWTAFKDAAGKAAPCTLDARIVKIWPQQNGVWGSLDGEYFMTPELLVRNDTLPLSAAWTGPGTLHPNDKGQNGFVTGDVIADLARDETRQFWVMASVPPGTKPGTYRASLTVKPVTGAAVEVPVELRVQPFTLHSASKRYVLGIYYRGMPWLSDTDVTEHMSPERMQRELTDIKDHGFNATTLFVRNTTELAKSLPPYRAAGLTGPVALSGWGQAYNAKFDDATEQLQRTNVAGFLTAFSGTGITPFFYGIDEPAGERIATNIKRADITRDVKAAGLKGLYGSAASGAAMEGMVGHLDYPIISSYFSSRPQMKSLRDKFSALGAHPLYYWQIWGEYPQGTRLNSGYFLYASGYQGIYPYAYRHFAKDPYREDTDGASGLKDMLVSYPSNEGPITTLQWEAARAGIVDLNYLVTLDDLLTAAGNTPAAIAARAELDGILKKYGYEDSAHWGRMIYGSLNWPEHQVTVPPEQFDSDRARVAALIEQFSKQPAKGTP